MKEFDEREHPRDKDGKFTNGNGKNNKEKLAEAESIYNTEPAQAPIRKSPNLTKQELAMYYQRLGEIKHGDHLDKLPNGDMIIPIETKHRGVLIIACGKYGNEKIKSVYSFVNKDDMYDTIARLKEYE